MNSYVGNIDRFYTEITKNNKPNNYYVIEPKELKLDDWIPCKNMQNTFVACLKENPSVSYIFFNSPCRIRLSNFDNIVKDLNPKSIIQHNLEINDIDY